MVGMSAGKLNEIDKLIEKDIAEKKLPGAVVLVGRKGKNRLSQSLRQSLTCSDD
jgi:hypothetical protein